MKSHVLHRLTACGAALALALSLSLPAAAADTSDWRISPTREAPAFTDTAESAYREAIDLVYETGLMNGRSETIFDPEAELMPEELVVACDRLYHLLVDGSFTALTPAEEEAWYVPYYRDLAVCIDYRGEYDPDAQAYVGGGDGAETPEERYDVLRWNFHATKYPVRLHMLKKLLALTVEAAELDLPAAGTAPEAPDWTSGTAADLYRAGILTGTDVNAIITRGEFAQVLARLVDPSLRQGA